MSRLVHVGQVVVDIVMYVPQLPEPGGDVLATESRTEVGGGLNVLVGARRQGLAAAYAGMHGTGPLGDLVRSRLAAEDIEVLQPRSRGGDTGFTVALVDSAGERTFATTFGAEGRLGAVELERLALLPDDVVYVSGYGLALPVNGPAVTEWLSTLDNQVIVDPGPLVAEIPAPILATVQRRADWWSCNEREAARQTGAADPVVAARQLVDRTGRAGVLVRTGPAGCVLATASGVRQIPGYPVSVVDTNGAGDAHVGAFVAALVAGLAPEAAAARANAAAAITVTRQGSACAPSAAEVDAFLGS
ncbi:MAG TPA: PfkB family carbohydrate kinase [Pseudonocardiaceae bacterium]|jgi:sugar/nucleoside kinase (ribokinase family)|nr:PfkB family carbohydrate kinase [Pseudonocardiaceae bacterium]